MLAFEGFNKALFLKESNSEDKELVLVTVQYYVDSMDELNDYLKHHSQKMREEGMKKFPSGYSASRRLLEIADEM